MSLPVRMPAQSRVSQANVIIQAHIFACKVLHSLTAVETVPAVDE
jgi:hypothetical protein